MDWMDIAVGHLDTTEINRHEWRDMCMQVHSYISCIDIVFECVKQLHRYLIDEKSTPFYGDSSIFNDIRLGRDDNEYFKDIRAAFGAHPVDLKEKNKSITKKRYASWPTTHTYSEYDFSVLLYSDSQSEPDIHFGFKLEQLESFFEKRYGYLEEIEKTIQNMKENFDFVNKQKVILKQSDPLAQLQILKQENEKRFNCDYYDEVINWLIIFFETDFTEVANKNHIECFRKKLLSGIDELYNNLQKVNEKDLAIEEYLRPKYSFQGGFGYAFAQISSHAQGHTHKRIIGVENVISALDEFIVFNWDSVQELYWLIIIGLHIKNGSIE